MTTRRIYAADMFASSTFALGDEQQHMLDLSVLAQSILGTSTLIYGLECVPTGPASLSVVINTGAIFSLEQINETAFGTNPTLPINTNEVLKYAYLSAPYTPAAIVPPVTVGNSRNDLVQYQFSEADGNNLTIPFWGGVTYITIGTAQIPIPNAPLTNAVDTQRIDSVTISVKTGTPAPTGTQVTPTPDAGYTGAWVITTAEGQTTITTSDIAEYPNAPFITESLTQKISQATADQRYAQIPQVEYFQGIINGGMVIARQTPFDLTPETVGYGIVDCMLGQVTGTTVSAGSLIQGTGQTFGTTGYTLFFSGVTVTGTGVVNAYHRMESNNAVNYKERTCSFSCIANHNVGSSVNYTVTIAVANAKNNFSAVTTVQTSSAIIVPTGTPTVVSFSNVVMPDTTNGIQILVSAACGAVTTKDFHITDMILNTGDTAIAFIPQDQVIAGMQCERYYQKSYPYNVVPGTVDLNTAYSANSVTTANGALTFQVQLTTEMVKTPTISTYSPLTGTADEMDDSTSNYPVQIEYLGNRSFRITNSGTIVADTAYRVHWVADARL